MLTVEEGYKIIEDFKSKGFKHFPGISMDFLEGPGVNLTSTLVTIDDEATIMEIEGHKHFVAKNGFWFSLRFCMISGMTATDLLNFIDKATVGLEGVYEC